MSSSAGDVSDFSASSVVEFINSFDFTQKKKKGGEKINNINLAGDAVLVWKCMNEIYPSWFDSQVHPENFDNDDDAMRSLLHFISEYHEGKYNDMVNDATENVAQFLKLKNQTIIKKVYALILLAALNGGDQKFVSRILQMSEKTQTEIKSLIQTFNNEEATDDMEGFVRAMTRNVHNKSKMYMSDGGLSEELISANDAQQEGELRNLRLQIVELQKKIGVLETEKENLNEKLNRNEKLLNEEIRKKKDYESQIAQRKDNIVKDFVAQNEDLEKQLDKFKKAAEAEKKRKKKSGRKIDCRIERFAR